MSAAGDGGMSPAAVRVKEEPVWGDIKIEIEIDCGVSEAVQSSYAEHEVVPGSELLQSPDTACTIRQSLHKADSCNVKQDSAPAAGSSNSGEYSSVMPQSILINKKLHACTICHKTFVQECSLKTHLRRVHSAKQTGSNITKTQPVFETRKRKQTYSCGFCGKGFTFKTNFDRHIRIHTGEKPFSCKICKKKFTQLPHLKSHKRVHTGEKPYSCEICTKKFSQSSHLATHILVHTGEKPFSCNVCNRQFARKCNLVTHWKIHTGAQAFSCDICKKQLTHSQHLVRHKLIHTGEKPFSCDICKKRFTQGANLARHKLIHARDASAGTKHK